MQIDPTIIVVVTPLLTAVLQAVKRVPGVAARTWLVPFVSVALGLGAGVGYHFAEGAALGAGLMSGLAAGLAAVGLYEFAKQSLSKPS